MEVWNSIFTSALIIIKEIFIILFFKTKHIFFIKNLFHISLVLRDMFGEILISVLSTTSSFFIIYLLLQQYRPIFKIFAIKEENIYGDHTFSKVIDITHFPEWKLGITGTSINFTLYPEVKYPILLFNKSLLIRVYFIDTENILDVQNYERLPGLPVRYQVLKCNLEANIFNHARVSIKPKKYLSNYIVPIYIYYNGNLIKDNLILNFMPDRRKVSLLIPYYIKDGDISVFLQKRSADMKTLPNYFGFFGGGAEGEETSGEALGREIKEELGIDLDVNKTKLFNKYEFLRSEKSVYLFEVSPGWEENVSVGEGDYGKWFPVQEALSKTDIIYEDKVVLNDLERSLLNKSIR